MLKNFFKIAIRSLLKHPGFTFINIAGLAIGITSSVLVILFVMDELSYDKHNKKADRIHRIGLNGSINSDEMHVAISCNPLGPTLKADYPFVENYVRLFTFNSEPLIQYKENKFVEKDFIYADSSFFDVFTAPMIKGDPSKALVEPNSVVLTQTSAKKYFSNEDPIGKELLIGSDKNVWKVTGVVADPSKNSHFHYNMLLLSIQIHSYL